MPSQTQLNALARLSDIGLALPQNLDAKLPCSDEKGPVTWRPLAEAVDSQFVDFNGKVYGPGGYGRMLIRILAIDVDSRGRWDAWAETLRLWAHGHIAEPSWMLETPRGGLHVVYVYKDPVHNNDDSNSGPLSYHKHTLAAIREMLDGDLRFTNHVLRSPVWSGLETRTRFIPPGHPGYTLDGINTSEVRHVKLEQARLRLGPGLDSPAAAESTASTKTRVTKYRGLADLQEQAATIRVGERSTFLAKCLFDANIFRKLDESDISTAIYDLSARMPAPLTQREVDKVIHQLEKEHRNPRGGKAREARNRGLKSGRNRRKKLVERDSYILELDGMGLSHAQIATQLARIGQELHRSDWIERGYRPTRQTVSHTLKRLRLAGGIQDVIAEEEAFQPW